jgi:hypothetical protein
VVAAFVKPGAPEAAAIVSEVQKLNDQHSGAGLKTFVVMMGGPDTKPTIDKLTTEKKITIPVTFLPGGTEQADIAKYKINPEARSTILLWRQQTVRTNLTNLGADKLGELGKATEELLK